MRFFPYAAAVAAGCILLITSCGFTQGTTAASERPAAVSAESKEENALKMKVTVNGHTFTAVLDDTEAARELAQRMEKQPLRLHLRDYGGFEKTGPLGFSLPANDSRLTSQKGDIFLYEGDQIVFFYGSNTWAYTRLAHIDSTEGWEEALGDGPVTVECVLDK
jgi:hypothetical protein